MSYLLPSRSYVAQCVFYIICIFNFYFSVDGSASEANLGGAPFVAFSRDEGISSRVKEEYIDLLQLLSARAVLMVDQIENIKTRVIEDKNYFSQTVTKTYYDDQEIYITRPGRGATRVSSRIHELEVLNYEIKAAKLIIRTLNAGVENFRKKASNPEELENLYKGVEVIATSPDPGSLFGVKFYSSVFKAWFDNFLREGGCMGMKMLETIIPPKLRKPIPAYDTTLVLEELVAQNDVLKKKRKNKNKKKTIRTLDTNVVRIELLRIKALEKESRGKDVDSNDSKVSPELSTNDQEQVKNCDSQSDQKGIVKESYSDPTQAQEPSMDEQALAKEHEFENESDEDESKIRSVTTPRRVTERLKAQSKTRKNFRFQKRLPEQQMLPVESKKNPHFVREASQRQVSPTLYLQPRPKQPIMLGKRDIETFLDLSNSEYPRPVRIKAYQSLISNFIKLNLGNYLAKVTRMTGVERHKIELHKKIQPSIKGVGESFCFVTKEGTRIIYSIHYPHEGVEVPKEYRIRYFSVFSSLGIEYSDLKEKGR